MELSTPKMEGKTYASCAKRNPTCKALFISISKLTNIAKYMYDVAAEN